MTGNLFYKTENKIMCCNGILALLALIIGFMAIVYLLYQVYSYIRCGCGRYGPFVSSYGKIKEDILEEARKVLRKADRPLKVTDLGCGSELCFCRWQKNFPNISLPATSGMSFP